MPSVDVVVSCPVHDSFRVQQVAGMFDVPLAEKATERFQVELPTDDADWQIGLIVGPSGSGKSTVARHAFADDLYQAQSWPADRAVIDCFGDLPVRKVVELFTAVGFGSPPSWIKPYQVLSCGERFRCDLARALAEVSGSRSRESVRPAPRPSSPDPQPSRRLRRIHQRRRSHRGQGLLGGDRQGHPPRAPALPVRRRDVPLRRRRVARARLGARHGDGELLGELTTSGGVFGDRRSSSKSIAAAWRLGNCLSVITI